MRGAFIECVAEVGGLAIEMPTDTAHFVSLDVLQRSSDRARPEFFDRDESGDRFAACETGYPGTCFLREDGSFSYEDDCRWSRSLASIVEAGALFRSVGGGAKFDCSGSFRGGGLAPLEVLIGAGPDRHASDEFRRYYEYRGGIITLLDAERALAGGACQVRALLPSMDDFGMMSIDLFGLVDWRDVRPR